MNQNYYLILFFSLLSIWSCSEEVAKTYESKPVALARMNEIIVVTDDDMWDSAVKDTFSYYFESAYPIMPTPEPVFDVRHFSARQLAIESLRKELRTYIVLADLSDTESATTKMVRRDLGEERFLKAKNDSSYGTSVGRDKWARGQIVIYIFGNSKKELNELIRKNYSAISKRIRLHDEIQLDGSIYVMKKESNAIMEKIKAKIGATLRIPGDYVWLKEEEENFIWFKKDTKEAAMNIVIQKFPYKDKSQLTPEHLVALRDEYGKEHVSSPEPNTYMVSNTKDLPVYDYTYDINGMYTLEIRGIWEMENDFLGGPYASYMIYNDEAQELIFIDAWLYAPGQKKRNYMMQLDYIVKTMTVD